MTDIALGEGEPRIFNVQGAAELEALLSLSTDSTRAGEIELISFGTGVDGHDQLLEWQARRAEEQRARMRAELAKVAKPTPKPIVSGSGDSSHAGPSSPALAAAAARGAGDPAGQAEMELAHALEHAAAQRPTVSSEPAVEASTLGATAARAAASPPKPSLYPDAAVPQYHVVFGGPFEGVHRIFDVDAELRPLLATADSRSFGPADGIDTRDHAEAKLLALRQARAASQWRSAPVEVDDGVVPVGERVTLTYPQGRAAIAALTPISPINEIRRVIKAAEVPIALHVGGGSPSHASPGMGRNRLDLVVEARRAFNMAIPSEWNVGLPVDQWDIVDEAPPDATVRANAVSPVTLIPARAPLISDRQVTCCLLVTCVVLLAAIVPLAMGVPPSTASRSQCSRT